MNLNATQVRQACDLLGWKSAMLSRRAKISFKAAWSARRDDSIKAVSSSELWAIRSALEKAGVRFAFDADGQPGAVLLKAEA